MAKKGIRLNLTHKEELGVWAALVAFLDISTEDEASRSTYEGYINPVRRVLKKIEAVK